MSTQTVYFNNPSSITQLQGQVGSTAGQINTSQISLTGSINNLSINRFVDKYTINNGLGPYQVDAIPITFRDTFGMPKFSNNLSTTTGASYATTGGANGLNYTIQQFDTTVGWDMVLYLPSSRTGAIQTTPVFQESVQGQSDNLGSWGITLADWNGPLSTAYSTVDQWQGSLGSAALGTLFYNFYTLCASGTTLASDRQTALNAIYAHPDYATIKNQFKYPFKTFNQIKSGSDFQFENLRDLTGNTGTFAYTGTDNNVYNTQITSTTYSPTGNLLPIAQNANAIGGKMGLFIFHMGDGNNMMVDTFAHQVASWGYAVAYIPGTPVSQRVNKFGLTSNIASLLANKTITSISSTYFVTGAYANTWNQYNEVNDNTSYPVGTASATAVNGFWRLAARQMLGTAPAQSWMERFYYQVKCVINQVGVAGLIDFNNTVVSGISGGGYAMNACSKFITTGNAIQYTVNGTAAPLFKAKAFVELEPAFYDYSNQVDAGIQSNANIYNNRFALGVNVLPCPLIALTCDGDSGNKVGMASPLNDNRFNHQLQTIFQCTKQYLINNSAAATTEIQILAKSAVFYKSAVAHTDNTSSSQFRLMLVNIMQFIMNHTIQIG